MNKPKVRSISEQENYANYLGLPLIGLNKLSFGEDNLINAYFTVNGKIAALVRTTMDLHFYHQHPNYLTDAQFEQGVLILYSVPKEFEQDLSLLLGSEYSKISDVAKHKIFQHSGLIVDFLVKGKTPVSSKLVHSIRYKGEDEREEPLRDQDVLDNIDADIIKV